MFSDGHLEIPPKSSLVRHDKILSKQSAPLSFDRAERINLEFQIGALLGGRDKLLLLGLIDDEIMVRTRISDGLSCGYSPYNPCWIKASSEDGLGP